MRLQELVAKNGSLKQVAAVATKPRRDLRAEALEKYGRANMLPLDSSERARLLSEAIDLMAKVDRETTPALEEGLQRRAKNRGWMVSSVVENACAAPAEVESK